jgi:hypothetical protein
MGLRGRPRLSRNRSSRGVHHGGRGGRSLRSTHRGQRGAARRLPAGHRRCGGQHRRSAHRGQRRATRLLAAGSRRCGGQHRRSAHRGQRGAARRIPAGSEPRRRSSWRTRPHRSATRRGYPRRRARHRRRSTGGRGHPRRHARHRRTGHPRRHLASGSSRHGGGHWRGGNPRWLYGRQPGVCFTRGRHGSSGNCRWRYLNRRYGRGGLSRRGLRRGSWLSEGQHGRSGGPHHSRRLWRSGRLWRTRRPRGHTGDRRLRGMPPRGMRMRSARGSTRGNRRPSGTKSSRWKGGSSEPRLSARYSWMTRVWTWCCGVAWLSRVSCLRTRRRGMPGLGSRSLLRMSTGRYPRRLCSRLRRRAGNPRHRRPCHRLLALGNGYLRRRTGPGRNLRRGRRLPRSNRRRSGLPWSTRRRLRRHRRRGRTLRDLPRRHSGHCRGTRPRRLSRMRRGPARHGRQRGRPTRLRGMRRRMLRGGRRVARRHHARRHGSGHRSQLWPRARGLSSRIHRRSGGSELRRPMRRPCGSTRCRWLRRSRGGSPGRGRQRGNPGPRAARLRRAMRSRRRRTGRPALHRSLSRRRRRGGHAGRPGRRGHRRRSLCRIIRVVAQELAERDAAKRLPLGPQRRFLLWSRLSLVTGPGRSRVIPQEFPGLEPAEHALLLGRHGSRGAWRRWASRCPSGRGDRRTARSPSPGSRARGLGIQLDVALRPGDAVTLLQVIVEPQLRDDARHHAQPGDERDLIHRREVEGARHRHLQALALHRQREREVLLGQRRGNRRQRRGGDVLELGLRGQRVARLLRQHRPQRLDRQVLELDQVGAQPAAIDHLGLEGLVELPLVDEALADQDRTELFRHEGPDSRRLP